MTNVGVSGAGRVFEIFYLPALRRAHSLHLIAVCEPDPLRREWLNRTDPELTTYSNFSEMIRTEPLEAVILLSPPSHHMTQAIEALRGDMHVFIEKPPALTLASAEELANQGRDQERIIWAGFNRRYFDPYIKMRSLLDRSARINMRMFRFRLAFEIDSWGAYSRQQNPNEPGTGVIFDVVTHQVDLVTHLLKAEIHAVQVLDHKGGMRNPSFIKYHLELQDGNVVECEAAHTDRYVEELIIKTGDRTMITSGSRFVESSRFGQRELKRNLKMTQRMSSLWTKFTRKGNPMQKSFELQLDTFGGVLSGEQDKSHTHGVMTILQNVRTLDACKQSLERYDDGSDARVSVR